MKKVAVFVTICMLLCCTTLPALAADPNFEFWAQCRYADNNNLAYDDTAAFLTKSTDNQSLYVKHWVYGGSDEYTNYFRAFRNPNYNTYYGAKWCTVGLKVPIQSSSIILTKEYGVAGRGNTNHYDYDGNYQVSLHGYYYDN